MVRITIHPEGHIRGATLGRTVSGQTGPSARMANVRVTAALWHWHSWGDPRITMVIVVNGKRYGAWDYSGDSLGEADQDMDRLANGLVPENEEVYA